MVPKKPFVRSSQKSLRKKKYYPQSIQPSTPTWTSEWDGLLLPPSDSIMQEMRYFSPSFGLEAVTIDTDPEQKKGKTWCMAMVVITVWIFESVLE